ncbi:hypothetical protein DPMN_190246 [Dreissena polymorpha]|uniref:Uncharacterized protein n=1 Tax=Dreissena polymorpha TaxID=45954 RepID=A0A9D4ICP1_DREPO|nr:hypothetical protein DPMN_189777 [Dreissena polymorpha]KAH3755550.1 hypothetical protein DPMN_190246 [Dreissena polymorpha]
MVKRAAALRNDIVPNRIKRLDDKTDDHNGMFSYYNTNKWYKSYKHSGKMKAIEEKISEEQMECETDNGASTSVGFRKSLCRSILLCSPRKSCPKDPRTLNRLICGMTVLTSSLHGKEYECKGRFSRFSQLCLRSQSTSFFKAVRITLRSFYSLLR